MAITKIQTRALVAAVTDDITANSAKTGITSEQASAITANTAKVTNSTSASDLTSGTLPNAAFPSTLPAAIGANLTALPAANITGTLPAISGANLTGVNAINSGRKNIIINGGMAVAQRSSSSVTVSNGSNEGYQTIDRMFTTVNASMGGAATVEQVDDAPSGISNALKYVVTTTNTTPSGNQYFGLEYKIESQDLQSVGYGTPEAKTMTFSFYMKSSNYTGSVSIGALHQDAGTSYFTATAGTPTTSWTRYSVVIPANTANVFNKNDNGLGMLLRINLDCSSTNKASSPTGWTSTRSDAVTGDGHFLAASGNEVLLTGLQLELGSVATDFEHRSYGEELHLCQRYFNSESSNDRHSVKQYHPSYKELSISWPVEMRAAPTFSYTYSGGDTIANKLTNKSVHRYVGSGVSDGTAYYIHSYIADAEL